MRFFFFLFLITFSGALTLKAQHSVFERVTIEDGLSQGMIFDILQSRDGFLWVATKDGLNRYDGYNFKVFSNDPFNPSSVAENTITSLFEDSRGWIWVGTDSKGIDLFDPKAGRFHHFSLNFKHDSNFTFFQVLAICEASDGAICVLQESNGIIRIPIPPDWEKSLPEATDLSASTTLSQFPNNFFPQSKNLEPDILRDIQAGKNGNILVYTTLQKFELDPIHGQVREVLPGTGDDAQSSDFWVGRTGVLIHYVNNKPNVVPGPKPSPSTWIMASSEQNGAFWVALNNQLWHILPGETPDFSKPDWELDENISSVEVDRNGNIWAGTIGYGLRKINPRKQSFHTGATGNSIAGLWRDARGRYYCKVVNKLYPYDPQSGTLIKAPAFPTISKRIFDVLPEPGGALWILGRGEIDNGKAELWHYEPQGEAFISYSFDIFPYINARLLQSRSGQIWITGLNCQLISFRPQTGRFEYFSYASLFQDKANTIRAMALVEDGNGILWIGTQQGLVKAVPQSEGFNFQLIQADPANTGGLNNNSIACLLPDPIQPNAVLWIGTKGGGVNRLDINSGQFQHLGKADGLPDMVIYGILASNTNNPLSLWCSTNRGLAKISAQKAGSDQAYDIVTFTAAKGLQDNEFNTQAFSKAINGELLFGGVNGLNHFFPEEVSSDTTPPPVYIVGIEINHQPIADGSANGLIPAPVEQLRELHLNYDQNNISFEFSALDFTDPARNRYRYRLIGLDGNWVEKGNQHFAHFTHLAPGRYEFRVQGSNGEGIWQELAHPVVVIISPPWYQSVFAYLVYFLLLGWGVWQAYQFQIRRVKIREQLAYEHRETARVKALEQLKTNFFSNVTHEFRTPLTLIIEPLRQYIKNPLQTDGLENIRLAEQNSRKLLGLVNQLLDMAKLESGGMTLQTRLGNLEQLVRDVFETFLPLAEKRGIKLGLTIAERIPPFSFDAGKVEQIINNLLSNALKFTPEGGQVDLICHLHARDKRSDLSLTVRDTGIGIPKEAIDKVFDRFYQVDGSFTRKGEGTGIGLALSKELAELMGGRISVLSPNPETAKGSCFVFWLPVRVEESEKNQIESSVPENTTVAGIGSSLDPQLENGGLPVALIVEDNLQLRQFIKKSIAPQWQVVEASDGEEGIQKATELLPDVVISDLMMPGKDGYALCDELKNKEITAHIPIILLTAKAALDSKLKGLRRGADDYLTKPFNLEELLTRMENLVEIRRKLRERYQQQFAANPGMQQTQLDDLMSSPDQEFLRRFSLLVEAHLDDENMSIEDFSAKMLLSRSQLHRKLNALTGQNTSEFVRNYRLDRAMAMLKKREGLVGEIALRTGFGNEKYFSTVFREKFGVSPSQV